MITFNNLVFAKHQTLGDIYKGTIQALVLFDNGYGVSVITGPAGCGLYGDIEEGTYEVAAIKGTSLNWNLVYPEETSFKDDVLGHKTPEEVTELMIELQKLPSCN